MSLRRPGRRFLLFPAFALSLGWMAAAGCSSRVSVSHPASPLSLEEAAEALEPIRARALAVTRYQAVLRIRGDGPDGRFSATQVVVFERPDRFRVELLGPFGSTRWVAASSGGEITVLFPGRREFLKESRVDEVVAALIGVKLRADEVMAVLAGSGLPLEDSRPVGAYRRGKLIEINLGRAAIKISGGQIQEAEREAYRVRYPTPWKLKGRPAPDRIEIETPEIEARLAVEDLDINLPLAPDLFSILLPEEATRLELAEIEGEAVFLKTTR